MAALLRKWLVAGLLIWLPLAVTLLTLRFVIGVLDTSLLLIPASWRVPGLGVLLSLALVLGTGALAANYLGANLLKWTEGWLSRLPLLGSVYGGMKKLAETLLSRSGTSFRQVLLVEYPRKGVWTLAFQTGVPPVEAQRQAGEELVSVFVPTTPNPTSGFLVVLPRRETIPLAMSVEEGLRLVISLGVVGPEPRAGTGGSSIPPT